MIVSCASESDAYAPIRVTAVVSRYRTRGAIREVGKALSLSEDTLAALAGQIWGWSNDGVAERYVEELNLDLSDRVAHHQKMLKRAFTR